MATVALPRLALRCCSDPTSRPPQPSQHYKQADTQPAAQSWLENDRGVEHHEQHEAVQTARHPGRPSRMCVQGQPPPGNIDGPEQAEKMRGVDPLAEATCGANVFDGVCVRPVVKVVK